jgi:hypothetical protein
MLKGQCREIFDLWFFHQAIPTGALINGLMPLAYGFKMAKIFEYEIADFGTSGINDTARAKIDP